MKKDIIVIGGSSGSLQPLEKILSTLSPNFPGHVLITLHTGIVPRDPRSILNLNKISPIEVKIAQNGDQIKPGVAHIAPANKHLMLEKDKIVTTSGPRENRARPAIDPLFRSAAYYHNTRTIAVLLSGQLDDGSAGLEAVEACGGTVILQDPQDAAYPEMLSNALEVLEEPAYSLKADKVSGTLEKLVNENIDPLNEVPEHLKLELDITRHFASSIKLQDKIGASTPFTCPDCDGPLWEINESKTTRFRCHTGHGLTAKSLLEGQAERIEVALYSSLRILEERARMQRRIYDKLKSKESPMAKSFYSRYQETDSHVQTMKKFLTRVVNYSEQ